MSTDVRALAARSELLAPAGGMEQLKAALRFGADAAYGGLTRGGLRAAASNFGDDELREAVRITHERGKRFYITLNLLPYDRDREAFLSAARVAYAAGCDAAIVADLGAALWLRDEVPELPLHISTQANVMNSRAALHYQRAVGARRIVLSREMTLDDIRAMRAELPEALELEAFVHGAMCVAHSGRCLLSAALTGRSANRGACAQPCRWRYGLVEERRPGEILPLVEDERGSYLLSARDLCMLPHLPELLRSGVSSLKIEGRMKTAYYVATVVSAYRRALDALSVGGEKALESALPALTAELDKASHRPFCTGFYFGAPEPAAGAEGCGQERELVAEVTVGAAENEPAEIALKSRFFAGDALEEVPPGGARPFAAVRLTLCATGETVDTCGVAGTRARMTFPFAVEPGDLVRGPNRNHRTFSNRS